MRNFLSQLKNIVNTLLSSIARLNLSNKLILSYIIIVAIPVSAFGIYAFKQVELSNEQTILKNNQQAILNIKSNINRNIDICQKSVQLILSNSDLLEFISREGGNSPEELLNFKRGALNRIENIKNTYSEIYECRVFTANKDLIEIWPTIYGENRIQDTGWENWKNAMQSSTYWRLTHTDHPLSGTTAESKEVVSLYKEIKGSGRKHIGILEINMLAQTFFPDLYNPTDNSFVCLIRENNELIFDNNNRFIKNLSIAPDSIRESLSKMTTQQEGFFRCKIGTKPAIVVYTNIKELDGTLYHIMSVENVMQKLNETRNLIIFGSLGAIVTLSIVTYYIISIILKKMRIIISSMRKVKEGNLNIEIPIDGDDEIGELARHFREMLKNINELIGIIVKKQEAAKDAAIQALQSQINSHFIYNSLENIKMMAEIDYKYEISDALTSLGGLLRYSMSWSRNYVLLREEIAHVNNYIDILRIRYHKKINLYIDVSDKLLDHEVLKMTIQPIVENAFNHGIELKGRDGTISINAFVEQGTLNIDITDDGVGMSAERLEQLRKSISGETSRVKSPSKGHGIGLKNVNERIKLFFGEEYGLEISSQQNIYTTVRIKLPYKEV